jgi:hypothetical protein
MIYGISSKVSCFSSATGMNDGILKQSCIVCTHRQCGLGGKVELNEGIVVVSPGPTVM